MFHLSVISKDNFEVEGHHVVHVISIFTYILEKLVWIIVWTSAYPIQQEPGYWVKPNVLKQYVFTVWQKSSKPTVYWLTGSNSIF